MNNATNLGRWQQDVQRSLGIVGLSPSPSLPQSNHSHRQVRLLKIPQRSKTSNRRPSGYSSAGLQKSHLHGQTAKFPVNTSPPRELHYDCCCWSNFHIFGRVVELILERPRNRWGLPACGRKIETTKKIQSSYELCTPPQSIHLLGSIQKATSSTGWPKKNKNKNKINGLFVDHQCLRGLSPNSVLVTGPPNWRGFSSSLGISCIFFWYIYIIVRCCCC